MTVVAGLVTVLTPQKSFGQAFGVELQASLLPASGGMGGAGIARPQDIQTSLALNPATLAQKKGSQFSFSSGWVEPTINLETRDPIPLAGVQPFAAKSQRPGSIVGNIGVTQDFTALGLPATVGMGLLTASGLGVNDNDAIASNGTSAEMAVLQTAVGAGVELTDRLSMGFQGTVGSASMDGIFADISSSTPAYNLRAALGLTYDLRDTTTIGAYWHTEQKFTFDNFVQIGGPTIPFQDFKVSLPDKYGIGIADESLIGGKLLVAVDFMYFRWSETDFFGAFWCDQFAVQTGLQYTTDRGYKLRTGYVYAENASKTSWRPASARSRRKPVSITSKRSFRTSMNTGSAAVLACPTCCPALISISLPAVCLTRRRTMVRPLAQSRATGSVSARPGGSGAVAAAM